MNSIREAVEARNWNAMLQIVNRLEQTVADQRQHHTSMLEKHAALETRCNLLESGLNNMRTKLMKVGL